jgi:polysaccharide biosynthesis protein PelC
MKIRLLSGCVLFAVAGLILAGCAGMGSTVFIHRDYNFTYVEKVAVVPFENLSNDQSAASRVTLLFVTELLSTDAFDVVEQGEVLAAISKISMTRSDMLTEEQTKKLGESLGVQAVILGTVNEATGSQAGGNGSVMTLDVRMVETESAQTVWSATHTEGGRGFLASLFGTGAKSQSEVARQCVHKIVKTLVK